MARSKARTRRRFGELDQLPSGRWRARYTGPDLQRHSPGRTFQAQDDAVAWLRAEELLVERGEWSPPAERQARAEAERTAATLTLDDFGVQWLESRDLRPSTRDTYTKVWGTRVRPYLGAVPLAEVTAVAVRQWWADLGREHATPTRNAHAYQLLRAVMNTAVEDGLAPGNPCTLKTAGRSPKAGQVDLLTVAELDAITAKMPAHYAASVPVMAWCALRFGEATELRRKDIAGQGRILRIRRGVTYVKGEFIVGPPKSADGIRDVVVPPHIVPVLAEHLEKYVDDDPEALVFTTRTGARILSSTYREMFRAALAKAGVTKSVKVHDLRHLGGTLAAQAGATTRELMARLGHSTPNMAMRYQHVAAGRDAEVARRMAELAGGADE